MTTDHIQNKHVILRSRIAKFRTMKHDEATGLELTRLENFLDGRQDIFDVLEKHAANKKALHSPLQIDKPSNRYKTKPDHKFEDFWSKLKSQIKRLREEEQI